MNLITEVAKELVRNGNKISQEFVDDIAKKAEYTYFNTKNTVICVIRLETGHELIGYAQVIDEKNFDLGIGKKIARKKAIEKLWQLVGSFGVLLK